MICIHILGDVSLTALRGPGGNFTIKYLHTSFHGKVYVLKSAYYGDKYLSVQGSGKYRNIITQTFVGS